MKCGHPSTTEASLSSNFYTCLPRGLPRFRDHSFSFRKRFCVLPRTWVSLLRAQLSLIPYSFLTWIFLTLLTCIELYNYIYNCTYNNNIHIDIYIYIHVSLYMYMLTARKPAQRFCIFLRCDILGGWGCNNVLCLRYHQFSSANTLHVTLHTSFVLGWTHFMLRCTRLLYLGEHTSCCVAHRGFRPRLMCTYIIYIQCGAPQFKLVCKTD